MLWGSNIVPWLCWIFPMIGGVLALLLAKFDNRVRAVTVVSFSFLGWLMAVFMVPELFTPKIIDKTAFWITLPGNASVSIGMLVDPLSVILANVVAFLGFIIMVYSIKYVEDESGQTRYWFLMSLFIGSMLLLVLADNLILFFIGWKIVGLCSYALIGHYYSDEREHWIGGPSPFPFQKPSRCGLKALLVTTFGDVSLLAGVIMLYLYSGTFNFVQLYQTADAWLGNIAANPGLLTLTSILLLGGPIAKSAQFPLHEWLPEAMAGPTPVSALIHAATMVKAGVYFVARMLPVFFYAYWIGNYPEALTFFLLTAAIGAFTAFLTGTQAMVSKELKKVLAYSTMSQIGYMMLALGVAGLSVNALTTGVSAGIFHLISHGVFKAALFLSAGVLIHFSGSIYMSEMKFSRRSLPLTWLFMWIVSLSLMGVPPFSGFWSKDEVLLSCLQSGQYLLFTVALVTVAITCFYTVRFMGIIFHGTQTVEEDQMSAGKEKTSGLLLVPYGILAALTVVIGLAGPWVNSFLHSTFEKYFTESLGLTLTGGTSGIAAINSTSNPSMSLLSVLLPIVSVLTIVIGAFPAYRLYVSHKSTPEKIIGAHKSLQSLHKFLWNRWYIDAFYRKVFVNGMFAMRQPVIKYVERPIDYALNEGVPNLFAVANRGLRKVQTGVLSINMLYVLAFLATAVFILLLLGVL